jgi:hypothetical protein
LFTLQQALAPFVSDNSRSIPNFWVGLSPTSLWANGERAFTLEEGCPIIAKYRDGDFTANHVDGWGVENVSKILKFEDCDDLSFFLCESDPKKNFENLNTPDIQHASPCKNIPLNGTANEWHGSSSDFRSDTCYTFSNDTMSWKDGTGKVLK